MPYIKEVVREPPMNITLTGYQVAVVMQALQESDLNWERKISDAETGHHAPNFDITGAKLCRDDLREVIEQIRQKDSL